MKFKFIFLEELFGFPLVKLNLSSNSVNGLICVRLCMIDEKTSSSILLSRGVINLTHHKSHEHPQLLNIHQIYKFELIFFLNSLFFLFESIEVRLSPLCVNLPSGCRLRLSLSTSYWPIIWPSTDLSTLTYMNLIYIKNKNKFYFILEFILMKQIHVIFYYLI